MKRAFYIISIVALAFACSCSSTKTAEQRALEEAMDSIAYVQAVEALDSMDFIVPARSVNINGKFQSIVRNETANYICIHNGEGIVQLAAMNSIKPGPNGIGGITVRGKARLQKRALEKNGTLFYEFYLQATPQSVIINLTLPKGSTYAQVEVKGNMRSGNLFLNGNVKPFEYGNIVVGNSW